jgi:16S rRNA G966 N2-methylase RsmD
LTITYSTVRYGDIDVCWTPELDGGGMGFGQDYLPVVTSLFGHVHHLCEMCAGPGFIGFSLLARGLCDELTLTDINPAAVAAAQETVRRNGLEDRVTVHRSDGLGGLPSDDRYDLVVSNPPHFATPLGLGVGLLTDDVDWRMHRAFYADVGRFLAPGGSVLFQENSEGALPADFVPMIEAGGLEHVRTYWFTPTGNATVFYLWAKAALPGLIADDGDGEPTPLELAHPSAGVTELPSGVVHAPLLRNRTGRSVTVRILDARGAEPLGARAREFLALTVTRDGELTLPRMALRPGDYLVVDDEAPDIVLARLRVPD